jgi:hypothetical protein
MRNDWEHNFVIGRVHIAPQRKIGYKEETSFEEKIFDFISKSEGYAEKNRKGIEKAIWVFGNVSKQNVDGEDVFYGKFGKLKGTAKETLYDKKARNFIEENLVKQLAQSYSNFVIHPKTQIIIFEERRPDIRIDKFVKIFENSYLSYFPDLPALKIRLMVEEGRVFNLLKDKKVVRVTFQLIPSNPDDREIFKRLDEMFHKSGIKDGKMQFDSPEGLNVQTEGGIVREAIGLSDAGYGAYKARIEGEGTQTISSKDNIIRETIPLKKSDNLIKILLTRFKKYLKGEEKK